MPIYNLETGARATQQDQLLLLMVDNLPVKLPTNLGEQTINQAKKLLETGGSYVVITGSSAQNQGNILDTKAKAIAVNRLDFQRTGSHTWLQVSEGKSVYSPFAVLTDIQLCLLERGLEAKYLKYGEVFETPINIDIARRDLMVLAMTHLQEPLRGMFVAITQMAGIHTPLEKAQVDTSSLDLQRSAQNESVTNLKLPAQTIASLRTLDQLTDLLPQISDKHDEAVRNTRVHYSKIVQAFWPLIEWAKKNCIPAEQWQQWNKIWNIAEAAKTPIKVVWKNSAPNYPIPPLLEQSGKIATQVLVAQQEQENDLNNCVIYFALVNSEEFVFDTELSSNNILIADFSALSSVELLESARKNSATLEFLAARADFYISNNDNHDIVLGMLASAKRINSMTYDADHSLQNFIHSVTDPQQLGKFLLSPLRAADYPSRKYEDLAPNISDLKLIKIYFAQGGLKKVISKAWGRLGTRLGKKG